MDPEGGGGSLREGGLGSNPLLQIPLTNFRDQPLVINSSAWYDSAFTVDSPLTSNPILQRNNEVLNEQSAW